MNRTLLLVLLITLSLPSFGQKIRFSDTTNRWLMYKIECCYDISTPWTRHTIDRIYCCIADSGFIYQQISGSSLLGYNIPSMIREDTIAKKVFIKGIPAYTTDTAEKVLYDFNLHLGDTMKFDSYTSYVSRIDSTMINGSWYKVWSYTSGLTIYNVIEEIGCTNGILYPALPYAPFEYSNQLVCFHNQGNAFPLSNPVSSWGWWVPIYFDNISLCDPTLEVQSLEHIRNEVQVIPNPINKSGKIVFRNTIKSGNVIIMNSLGQAVLNTSFQNKTDLFLGDKIAVPGVYYYRVTDNNSNQIFSGKFVHL